MNSKQQARKIYELCVGSARPLRCGEVLEHLGYRQPVSGNAIRFGLELVRIACASKGADGECVLRYDNEAGKGDHRHVGDVEQAYRFTTPERLVADFFSDIERWLDENRDA